MEARMIGFDEPGMRYVEADLEVGEDGVTLMRASDPDRLPVSCDGWDVRIHLLPGAFAWKAVETPGISAWKARRRYRIKTGTISVLMGSGAACAMFTSASHAMDGELLRAALMLLVAAINLDVMFAFGLRAPGAPVRMTPLLRLMDALVPPRIHSRADNR